VSRPMSARVECLDGLRGLAALWVLMGHCVILAGWSLAIIDKPDLGVDLFMMLSGFLMVFHYQERAKQEPWSEPGTWLKFWARRYFRISPLYYLALVFALGLGPMILVWRNVIDHFSHLVLYPASIYIDHSFANIALHLSFLFGLLPAYSVRTPLPDWSLGLEMQFYAVFPALILLTRRFGWVRTVFATAFLAAVITHAPWHLSLRFPMPSFLPFKIDIFLAGMLIADSCRQERKAALFNLALALLLAFQPFEGEGSLERLAVRQFMVLMFFSLIHSRHLPGYLGDVAHKAAMIFGSKGFRWLDEVSYGTYLWHLPIMAPIVALVIAHWGHGISAFERFAFVFPAVCAIVYPLSWFTFIFVEKPAQLAGRSVVRRIARKPAAMGGAETVRARGEIEA
jgi:peptidoglycan/LPS O-acetylase OafA/YrhL